MNPVEIFLSGTIRMIMVVWMQMRLTFQIGVAGYYTQA